MDYVICPFNAEHKIRGTELRMHIMKCQDKRFKEIQKQVDLPIKKKTNWKPFPICSKQEEPDIKVFDPQDPERPLQCPYDSNHQIRACRFPYHLIKCRKLVLLQCRYQDIRQHKPSHKMAAPSKKTDQKVCPEPPETSKLTMQNHPDVAMQLATCPFNARHMIPRAELSHHISNCDDKSCIEQDIVDEKSIYKRDVTPSLWHSPPCNEDWDQDLQTNASTFMWGIPSYPVPSSGTLMDPKSSLGSNLRAPKSLPYVLPWKMNTGTS